MSAKIKRCWIIGQGGIGHALAEQLEQQGVEITVFSRQVLSNSSLQAQQLDSSQESQVEDWLSQENLSLPDCIVNCCGFLHEQQHLPEKSITQMSVEWFEKNLQGNLYTHLFWLKHLTKLLNREKQCFYVGLSARVSSISDNRLGGWHSYRMSKATLNMLIKNVAIEWGFKSPQSKVFGYHPGTVDTALSKPFSDHVPKEKLFSPEQAAGYLAAFLMALDTKESGCLYDWQKAKIDW